MKRAPALRELGEAERSLPVSRKLEEAQRSYEEARAHRAALRSHQKAQQLAMQRFDLFRADLEAMGIEVIIEPATYPVRIDPTPTARSTHPKKEGTVDDRSSV